MNNKVIVALDYETEKEALGLVDQLEPSLCRLKVGKEMFTTLGTNFVKQLHNRKFDVFLDKALNEGFDKIAMGHYTRISEDGNGKFHLLRGIDHNKDQTYFLS